MGNTYAGFTIGPIYDVMSHCKKTREIWFASYFFSWFIEGIIEKLSHRTKDEIDFLTPHITTRPLTPNNSKIGKYHDRFIIKSNLKDKEELFNHIKEATEKTLEEICGLIERSAREKNK